MEPHGFLQQALVYLAAGVIAVPLFKRLGLGSVLGYLVAGVAIGPWGLRLIADPQTVLQFAEFGVVLLLFLVGLELNAARVWALRRSIFGLGGAQVIITIAAVAAAAAALGQPLVVGVIAGMGFAMSSTAIGLATLTEKNLLPTPGGQASFAVLLFQDLAVIPLMLVVGLLGGATGEMSDQMHWSSAAKALGMIALLIVAGRLLVRPVLRYIAETRLREVFVGFSLLLVLGTAALMEWVGLSMALGAFLAGVMLADSEYRHELELDIEPFKGLLLGLFFIAVGMSVDIGLFLRAPQLVLGVALGVVALKIVLLYAVARPFYCGGGDAALFAVALSQAGEFAFVLFGAAAGLGVFAAPTAQLLVMVVTLSMLLAPPFFALHERLLGRWLAQRAPPEYDSIDGPGNPVIVAGFGRFGQIVSRVLRMCGLPFTALEANYQQVDFVRRFGSNKVYYGDASRLELLHAAKAGEAKLFVLAIDDVEASVKTAAVVRRHFPDLPILARARNRVHYFRLRDLGIKAIHRETFPASLDVARQALLRLGFRAAATEHAIALFRQHDEAQLEVQYAMQHDEAQLIQSAREAAEQLRDLFEADSVGPLAGFSTEPGGLDRS